MLKAIVRLFTGAPQLMPETGPPNPALEELHRVLIEEWWPDRSIYSKDRGSARLCAALALAFPETIHTREHCAKINGGCGIDAYDCDECMSRDQVPDYLQRCRSILDGSEEQWEAAPPSYWPFYKSEVPGAEQ